MNNYYIYFHINPLKNEIFYVGKGKGKRAYSKNNRNNYWYNTTKRYGYIIDITEDGLTEQEAFEREIFYINKIGRKDLGLGSLINMTNGGEGPSGIKHTDEAKKRTPEFCKLMKEMKKGVGLGIKKGNYNTGGYNRNSVKCLYNNIDYECLKHLWVDKFSHMKYGTFKDYVRKNKIEGLIRLNKNNNTL